MWQAIGQLLPIAVAAAVSLIPIMTTLLILVSDRRERAAIPFSLGWVLGATAFVTLATIAAHSLPGERPRDHTTLSALLEMLIGAALVVLGLVALTRRTTERARALPAWMTKIDSLDSRPAFGLGVALNVRPKALLLVAAAGLVLRSASLALDETVIVIGVFTVVATSTVVVPVLLALLSPSRMQRPLRATRTWLSAQGPTLTALTMVLIGALITLLGLTHL